MKKTDNKVYYAIGAVLCLLAMGYIFYACWYPEVSFPWPNWVTFSLYGLYALYTILVFLMPRFKDPSLEACVILLIEIAALGMIIISVGLHKDTNHSNWFLPAGLFLSVVGNFWNAFRQKRNRK